MNISLSHHIFISTKIELAQFNLKGKSEGGDDRNALRAQVGGHLSSFVCFFVGESWIYINCNQCLISSKNHLGLGSWAGLLTVLFLYLSSETAKNVDYGDRLTVAIVIVDDVS